jgi:hypothetical protein
MYIDKEFNICISVQIFFIDDEFYMVDYDSEIIHKFNIF